ncbi:restriction endonuclease [Legionella cardiaca]|uniref:Restriction endonuclease n=1 Tax=Legionella cardiaca TaxID=1071983 RepID=A0ABY8AV91_9GAMM|nr:restriction endonuclease [Legionella cardiaca]WED44610.1 restriction endonuclease [Legionella cardiaca]
MSIKKWKAFEDLVAKVQADLAPEATIKLDQKIVGRISRRKRQIDILVQKNIGNYLINIVIECKDLKGPVNVKSVEATIGLIKDVGANIGVIVSAKGFTKAALAVGEHAQLKLYRLIDTGNHDWRSDIAFPAICLVRNLRQFSFNIQYLGTGPIPLNHSMMLYNKEQEIGLANDLLMNWWINENNKISVGIHENIEFIATDLFLLIDNKPFPVKFTANLEVEEIIYFRKCPLKDISGFEDQFKRGTIETRGFTLSNFNIDELKNNWIKIKGSHELSIKPIISMHIATCAQL